MLSLASPSTGEMISEQLGEPFFGFFAMQMLPIHLKITALTVQKPLVQPPVTSLTDKVQLHFRRR